MSAATDAQTPILEAGDGPPVVLLHGPGGVAHPWRHVVAPLAADHKVVVAALPAHLRSGGQGDVSGSEPALRWLDELLEATCRRRPALVGHGLGGALAAGFAYRRPRRLRALVLVDSLGLASIRPSAGLALSTIPFAARAAAPGNGHARLPLDFDALALGVPAIPADELEGIDVPTTLIWGRHDIRVRVSVAEAASARHGWPLHVIDGAGAEPATEQPEAFLRALRPGLATDKEEA